MVSPNSWHLVAVDEVKVVEHSSKVGLLCDSHTVIDCESDCAVLISNSGAFQPSSLRYCSSGSITCGDVVVSILYCVRPPMKYSRMRGLVPLRCSLRMRRC